MNYPKIDTLWNRDPQTFKVVPGDLRLPEFALVARWMVTEKLDGDNVRVHLRPVDFELAVPPSVEYSARNGGTHLKPGVREWLTSRLLAERVAAAFVPGTEAILYGEAYGPRIQKGGGNYRAEVSFRLFDVAVIAPSRVWWLNWSNVVDVAAKLGIDTVPVLAHSATLAEAIELVKLPSTVAHADGGAGCEQEGIVCRTDPLLFTRSGERVMWKLKHKDIG